MLSRSSRPEVRVTGITAIRQGALHRVSANVDGAPVWFETADVPLRPSAEALGTAFLIPALHRRARLVIDATACPRWLANMTGQVRTFRRWWGTPELIPVVSAAPSGPGRGAAVPRTALCFSAGADSFHVLLHSGEQIDTLLTVHGFDIGLEDLTRMRALDRSLREISSERGVKSIVIRTNLREHPLIRGMAWERAHGGALAAIGHLLDESFGRLLIASSIPLSSGRESWGSHWKTDHAWSSASLAIVNTGAEHRRVEKMRAIAEHPLVQRHLRVCWENREPAGNCSRCQKCLLTMLILAECGSLECFSVFSGAEALADRVNALPSLHGMSRALDDLARSERLAPELMRAIHGLRRRSRRVRSLPVRARRYLLQAVMSWSHRGAR